MYYESFRWLSSQEQNFHELYLQECVKTIGRTDSMQHFPPKNLGEKTE